MIIVGGRLFKHSVVASGAAAHEAIGRISADVFFLGVTGIHPTAGLTTGDADEAAIKRAWSQRSAETYVLGSGEKIGAASPFEVLPLAAVTAVLTDSAAPERGRRRAPLRRGRGACGPGAADRRISVAAICPAASLSCPLSAAHRRVAGPADPARSGRRTQALLPRRDRGRRVQRRWRPLCVPMK